MLRFAIHDVRSLSTLSGVPGGDFENRRAHLIGPEEVVAPGKLEFHEIGDRANRGDRGGSGAVIECKKRGAGAIGIELLYDAGAAGTLMLQTCLLPDRNEPYSLAVELARHRIKMFIAKSEEWQMFDLSAEHPAMARWEEARTIFTDALTTSDPRKAEQNARTALALGIDATERLAMAHAEILLHRRFAQKPASSATLGVRVEPGRDAQPLKDIIQRDFDVLSVPIRWRDVEVGEGVYKWDAVDRWMDWAKKTGKPVMAGPLLDFSKASVPDWMYVWQNDYDTARDLVYDHIEKIVQRYAGVVGLWNIGAGVNINENFEFTPEQMVDLVRMTMLLIRHSRKGARVLLELTQPFGEYLAENKQAMAPLLFIDRLTQEGVRLDALGLRMVFGGSERGHAARDLMQASALLDRFFLLERPVIVTATGVPSGANGPAAGVIGSEFSLEAQARWAARFFAIAMSKPHVESIFWTDLYDHAQSLLPNGGLITADGKAKPVLAKLTGVRKRLRKPLGSLKLPPRKQAESAPTATS